MTLLAIFTMSSCAGLKLMSCNGGFMGLGLGGDRLLPQDRPETLRQESPGRKSHRMNTHLDQMVYECRASGAAW